MIFTIRTWAESNQSSDWPWLRNVSNSATLAKAEVTLTQKKFKYKCQMLSILKNPKVKFVEYSEQFNNY
jgi:hypothetical protein